MFDPNVQVLLGRVTRKFNELAWSRLLVLNLNFIERFCKLFEKQVLYNRYYETYDKFKGACEALFTNTHQYAPQLRSLLTGNFEFVGQ